MTPAPSPRSLLPSPSGSSARGLGERTPGEVGFTLIELMVVILIISIVALLAVPSLSQSGYERRVFTDAATIGEIVREARTRSVGRGAAQLLVMTTKASTNSASFTLYESVSANPVGATGANIPISTCDAPTTWPGAGGTTTANLVDEYQFTGGQTLEGQGNIIARIIDPNTGAPIPDGENAYLCFTPNGRVKYQLNAPTPGLFVPMSKSTALAPGAMVVELTRGGFSSVTFGADSSSSELVRQVWIPPSGATRITSL